jgi:succinate-acetate transporter protein
MSASTPATPATVPFAEPTPLGLIGLAIGCAALTPIAFGASLTPQGLETAAVFCALFGGGCQLLAGLMGFANRNLHGGTLLTAFSMNWFLNAWALHSVANGVVPDAGVALSVDTLSLVVFAVMTWAFGYFGKLLFLLLLDVTLLYAFRVVNGFLGSQVFALPIGVCTVVLAVLALWIAFAILLNPVAGRRVFPFPGPMYGPGARAAREG